LVTATKLEVAPNLRSLFRYLIENGFIEEITEYNSEYLSIHPLEVLGKLQSGDRMWERMVPTEVATIIINHGFFGYRSSVRD